MRLLAVHIQIINRRHGMNNLKNLFRKAFFRRLYPLILKYQYSSSSCIKVNISNVWTSNGQLVFWFVSRSGFENVSLELVEHDFRSESRKMAPLPNVKLKNIYVKDSALDHKMIETIKCCRNFGCQNKFFVPFFGKYGKNTWIILIPKPWINIIFSDSKNKWFSSSTISNFCRIYTRHKTSQ